MRDGRRGFCGCRRGLFAASALALSLAGTGCGGGKNDGDAGDMLVGGDLPDGATIDAASCLPALAGAIGGTCRTTPGGNPTCNTGNTCLREVQVTYGNQDEPIDNAPIVGFTYQTTLFAGGNCTRPSCSAGMCGPCAACVGLSTGNFCMSRCVASVADNGICRDGYECDLFFEICLPGCTTDDECRVRREDTDMNGEIEPFEYDPILMTGTGDHLVWDPLSTGTCNAATGRCSFTGSPTASAGDPCTRPEDCEQGGTCLRAISGYPGGYCIKDRCDLPGNECAGDGVCDPAVFGDFTCAAGCKVGTGAVEGNPSTYLDNTQGCRTGYTCIWNREGGVDDDVNGACAPGVFNAVTANNVGGDCTDDDDCYSPFGLAGCLAGPPNLDGQCALIDCASPGLPGDVCGTGNRCIDVSRDDYLCLRGCVTAADCRPGFSCADFDGNPSTSTDRGCWDDCIEASECRIGEDCVVPVGRSTGFCVPP